MTSPSPAELTAVPLFEGLDPTQCEKVARWFEVEDAAAGHRVTHEQADGYVFFILASGAAEVLIDGAVVRTLGPGDFFGEVSLVFGPRQTATVTVTEPSVLWRMFGTEFRHLQLEVPVVAARIEEIARLRLDSTPEG